MNGVDERVEEVGHIGAPLFKLCHDVPHGSMCVLATVFAHAHGIAHDVAWVVLRVLEWRGEQLYDLVLAVYQSVVGFAEDGGFLLVGGDTGDDAPCLRDEVNLAFGIVA